jgi:hypothetical protein
MRYLHREILDDRKRNLGAEFFVDIANLSSVRERAVDRQAQKFAAERLELVGILCERHELRRAHWREVYRMREQHWLLSLAVGQRAPTRHAACWRRSATRAG